MKLQLFLITASLIAPAIASADFQDGSFEFPTLTPGAVTGFGGTYDGWTLVGNYNSAIYTNQTNEAGLPTPDGNQYLLLNQYGSGYEVLSQSVALKAGANTLSFLQADLAHTTSGYISGGAVDVTILGPANNTVVTPTLFTTPSFSGFVSQSLTFNAATAGNYDFVFSVPTGTVHAAIFDGVSVQPAPEPASILALCLGVCAMGRGFKRQVTK